jgi:AraC-like DNA-binding protein
MPTVFWVWRVTRFSGVLTRDCFEITDNGKGKGKAMNLKLHRITDWPERAHAAKYCVKTLARRCDVSVRTLERFIKLKFAASPHDWMIDLRMRRAVELLPETASIKETSDQLGYKSQNHFSREFKKHYGHAPSLPLLTNLANASEQT